MRRWRPASRVVSHSSRWTHRDEAISQYTVVDGAKEQGAPLWAEVDWRNIGVEVRIWVEYGLQASD